MKKASSSISEALRLQDEINLFCEDVQAVMLGSAKGDARMRHPLRYRGALSGRGEARRRRQLGGSADASNMFLTPTEQSMTEMVSGILIE